MNKVLPRKNISIISIVFIYFLWVTVSYCIFLNPGAFCYYIYDKYYLSSVLGREPMTLVLLDQHCTAELLQQSNWFYKDTRCTCLYINLKYLICSCVKKNDGCSNIHLKCALLIFTGVKTYYIFFLCIQFSYWKCTWWVFTIFSQEA